MANTIEIKTPAMVTLENVSDRAVAFVPVGRNYTIVIKAGDAFKFEVNSAEDVMYYFGQGIKDVLKVSQEQKDAAVSD